MDEKFILVSLDQERSKHIANLLSNDTSRKILDCLAEKEMSETDISNKLNTPISTIHYNVQNLLKSNLIEIMNFMYSEKGNKINLYKVTKKMILIVPKNMELKGLALMTGLSLVASAIIYIATKNPLTALTMPATQQMAKSAMDESMLSGIAVSESSQQLISTVPNYALWFMAGSIFAIALYAIINYIKRK